MVGNMLRIGRDPANQIVLQDPGVAPFHAVLSEHQSTLYLRDENSSSGTFVNQVRIQGLGRVSAGAVISIGGARFTVAQLPEQTFAPPAARHPAKKLGCGCLSLWPLAIYLMLSIACLGFFGGAYYLYKAPRAVQQQALALIGQGPGDIQIENLSDKTVFVYASWNLDRKKDDGTMPVFLWEMNSFGTTNSPNQLSAVYRIDFGTKSGDMDLGTCIFDLKSGEVYHFVVLPGNIIVDRTQYPEFVTHYPTSTGEYLVATSSLCKYTPN
jgi:hypothetical protein